MEGEINVMKKILFIYDIEDEVYWKDGLWAAIKLLQKSYRIEWWNIARPAKNADLSDVDFVLGWGAFSSPVSRVLETIPRKKGLCLGGYALPPKGAAVLLDAIFYETDWSLEWLKDGPLQQIPKDVQLFHAFGTNTDIYGPNPSNNNTKIWDYISVGAFATWKRQDKISAKSGTRLAVGQIQKKNLNESVDILGELLLSGVMVSDMVPPETLVKLFHASKTCYIPANVMGGGERAVLDARACGIDVEVESDNPKLLELTKSEIWDHHYYAAQLQKGIELCLKQN